MAEKSLQVSKINQEISEQLADKETAQALLTTTFKGLALPVMKQALLEGMMRGFTFKNFLEKDVYALPFGGGYSLITSIDYMRKIAMETKEYAGKDAPVFTDDDTCSVTVKRIVGGEVRDFTATVYLSEYSTGKNQWATRPKTMLSKVAEMHALRMAFPEELSKAYIEEESTPVKVDVTVSDPIDFVKIQAAFDACKTTDEAKTEWNKLSKEEKADKSVIQIANEAKKRLTEKAPENTEEPKKA